VPRLMVGVVTFSVTEDGPAVIVLSQLDDRYFSEISGYSQWTLEFVVYRKGRFCILLPAETYPVTDAPASDPYASSAHTIFWRRSINVELDNLEAGDYVVHVRLDRRHIRNRVSLIWPEAARD
jgi:hypothetical protein